LTKEWNQILKEEWYSQEEPDELVVDFVALLNKTGKRVRALDLGCGAGRHLVYMTLQGFEVFGLDISETGLSVTKKRLKKQNVEAYLLKGDMKKLPYVNSCFDVVICLHTIYHQKFEDMKKTIFEIHRILKRKGVALINFLSKRTYSYAKGRKVEENTFITLEGTEKGVLHHFTDKREIQNLFKNFRIVELKLNEKIVKGKRQSRWILIATA